MFADVRALVEYSASRKLIEAACIVKEFDAAVRDQNGKPRGFLVLGGSPLVPRTVLTAVLLRLSPPRYAFMRFAREEDMTKARLSTQQMVDCEHHLVAFSG